MERVDVVVFGAGQSGLAAAHALLRQSLKPVALEATAAWMRTSARAAAWPPSGALTVAPTWRRRAAGG
ncbi:hypothetical protein ADL12_39055 [Streptomyces regalis]|uniref:FAD dependent oxidoreductase domain-containing protein n=1 Tax=Streptomyces regalis TaxID=68262 RepID=A0A101JBB8_9ACTN|nr:hypothetical protein ADL12_39055 [Streptomyces regalis]